MSLHGIKFVPKVSLASVSFWLVSVLFFFATLYMYNDVNQHDILNVTPVSGHWRHGHIVIST